MTTTRQYQAAFQKLARSVGATWELDRAEGWLTITLPDGRSLQIVHEIPAEDWHNAAQHLAAFVATPSPDPERFQQLWAEADCKEWMPLYV